MPVLVVVVMRMRVLVHVLGVRMAVAHGLRLSFRDSTERSSPPCA
jgi:hypothetical protein